MPEDSVVIRMVLQGNRKAFSMLVERHKGMVFSIVCQIVQNQEDAEEVAQDVFVKAYRSLESFEGKSKFSTWLYRIAYNTAISSARKKKIVFSPLDDRMITDYTEDDIPFSSGHPDASEQHFLLERALQQLSPDDKTLISLFYQMDKTVEEISQIMGLTVANVKVRLHRIRKKLYSGMNSQKEYQHII